MNYEEARRNHVDDRVLALKAKTDVVRARAAYFKAVKDLKQARREALKREVTARNNRIRMPLN